MAQPGVLTGEARRHRVVRRHRHRGKPEAAEVHRREGDRAQPGQADLREPPTRLEAALRGDTAVEEARAPGQLGRRDAEERRVPGQRIGQARRAAVQTEVHAEGSFLRAPPGGRRRRARSRRQVARRAAIARAAELDPGQTVAEGRPDGGRQGEAGLLALGEREHGGTPGALPHAVRSPGERVLGHLAARLGREAATLMRGEVLADDRLDLGDRGAERLDVAGQRGRARPGSDASRQMRPTRSAAIGGRSSKRLPLGGPRQPRRGARRGQDEVPVVGQGVLEDDRRRLLGVDAGGIRCRRRGAPRRSRGRLARRPRRRSRSGGRGRAPGPARGSRPSGRRRETRPAPRSAPAACPSRSPRAAESLPPRARRSPRARGRGRGGPGWPRPRARAAASPRAAGPASTTQRGRSRVTPIEPYRRPLSPFRSRNPR